MDDASHREGPVATLRYVVEVADYMALMRRATWRGSELLYGLLAPFGFAFAALILSLALWLASQGTAAAGEDSLGWFAGIGAAVGLGAGLIAWGAYAASFFGGLPCGAGEPLELVVSDSGLEERAPTGLRTVMPWGSIAHISEGPDHVFVFLSRLYAVIVPKRAFSSPAEASQAANWMRERWLREAGGKQGS